jgi:hypothetical protein
MAEQGLPGGHVISPMLPIRLFEKFDLKQLLRGYWSMREHSEYSGWGEHSFATFTAIYYTILTLLLLKKIIQ